MSGFDEEDSPDLQWLTSELSAIRRELTPAGESHALYLALDQGGTSSRAVLYDAVGREVALAHVPITTRRQGDRVEHVPDELVQSLLTAARDACDSPLVAGRPIVAAGLATQRSTICCWDKRDGSALSPAISWADRRNARWLDEHLGLRANWVRMLTGLPLSPHYGASKLRWCLDELPAVKLALRDERLAAGPLAAFLLHQLCEAERPLLVDPANAARTLLFDPALLDWSAPLLEAFEIPREVLPACVGTAHDYGTLALPGPSRVPVRACSGDQSAALFAFGVPSPGTAYANVGTGAFVQRTLRDAAIALPHGLLKSVVFAHTDEARSALCCHEGTVNGAHAAIEWLRGRVALDVTRALGAIGSTELAESTTLLFMNGVGGLGAPYWSPDFPVEFLTLDGPVVKDRPAGSDMEQLAAVLDSIAFLIAVNVQAMERSAPLQRIVVTGGLASCDYLCDVLAEVTGLSVERPELHEATARGIAFLAAGQPADWQPAPLDRTFAPRGREAIRARFTRWREETEKRVTGGG
jgi:glycerol kinase